MFFGKTIVKKTKQSKPNVISPVGRASPKKNFEYKSKISGWTVLFSL